MTDANDKTEVVSAVEMLEAARTRLRQALALLGERDVALLSDDEVVGAGILASAAGEMFEDAFRLRIEEAAAGANAPDSEG